jgi:hypothetical protein
VKPRLLYADREFDRKAEMPEWAGDLTIDLGLEELWREMSGGDRYLTDIARRVSLTSLHSVAEIEYRQRVAMDFLSRSQELRMLYQISVEALEAERRVWGLVSRHPAGTLHRGVEVLSVLMPPARRLRDLASSGKESWQSPGLKQFVATLEEELDDAYLARVDSLLRALRLEAGALFSARLGRDGHSTELVLRRPVAARSSWGERLGVRERSRLSFSVDPRDESGLRALSEFTDRGLVGVASATAQAADHVLAFFSALRFELGFYVCCLNLHSSLAARQLPVCWPSPQPQSPLGLSFEGLYDLGLALRTGTVPVGNDLSAQGVSLLVLTGANSGGKSTFLRSLGIAQLLTQAGMFVGARSFSSSLASGVLSHFVRPEDDSMTRGRLADELSRMSRLADLAAPGGLVLLNESFSSTNELEGSEIARQVLSALLDSGIRVAIVTHFFELADGLRQTASWPALFLRAERLDDGSRTFRMLPGDPLPTAYGSDLIVRLNSGNS